MRRGKGWYLMGVGDVESKSEDEEEEERSWEEEEEEGEEAVELREGVGVVESGEEEVGIRGADGSGDRVADRGEGEAPRFEVSTITSDEGEMVEEVEEAEAPSKELLPPPTSPLLPCWTSLLPV